MNIQKIAELRAGLETGFINSGYNSSLAYQPQFLSNNHKEGKKVLSSIEDELMTCDKFQISVAFITMGGITPLLQTLKELEKEEYKERYQIIKRQREIAKSEETLSIEKYRLKLNAMQVGFITNLRKILEKGEDRALLISATGERGIFVTGGRNPGFKRVSEAWS